jgi:hypothetical protein
MRGGRPSSSDCGIEFMEHLSAGSRLRLIAIGLVFLAYAGVRLVSAPPILEKPRILADTTAYTRISAQPIGKLDFWAGSRPVAFPLLLKIAHQDYSRSAALQLGISILAWGLLALAVSGFLKFPWLQAAGFALVLLFSLDRHIAAWDFVMMTESLSLSSLALFIAAGLWLLRGWRFGKVAAFFLAALLLAFTRDTNAWMVLGLAGLILIALLARWLPPRAWILVVLLGLVFLLSDISANLGERSLFPLGNLITQRVLPDASALQYFEKCGMPVSPALLELSGKFANSDDQAMFSGPDLDAFRNWLRDRGRTCYVGWLVTDPISSVRAALYQTGELIAFSTVDRFFSVRYVPLLPTALGAVLYPEQLTLWIWACSTLVALVAILRRSWRDNRLWAAYACMSVLIFPHLFLTWHGDAMAPDRHALSVGVQLYLGFWMLVLLLLQHPWFGRHEAA